MGRRARGSWPARAGAAVLVSAVLVGTLAGVASASVDRRSSSPVRRPGRVVLPSPGSDSAPVVFPAGTTIAAAQAWCGRALALRSGKLVALGAAISLERSLSASTKSVLSATINADAAGITALSASVSSASSLPALDAITSQMVNDYRVFSVLTPQVNLVVRAASQEAAVSSLAPLVPSIEAAISTDEQAGKPVAAAQRALKDLSMELASVSATDASVTASALLMRPSSYPSTISTVGSDATALDGADFRLETARADLAKIVRLLAARGLSASTRLRALLRG